MFESTLASLGPPPVRIFDAINHDTTRYDKAPKQREPIMIGSSAKLYTTDEDLVVLKQPEFEDMLTSFVQRYLPVFLW